MAIKNIYYRPLNNNLTLIIELENGTFQWRVIRALNKDTVKYCPIQYATLEAAQKGYLERKKHANSGI